MLLILFTRIINKSIKKDYLHESLQTTHFHVQAQLADGKSGILTVRGKNKRDA